MPAGIAGIMRARKPHGEGAEVGSRPPASLSDELVEGGMKQWTVDGFPEGFVAVIAEADDWLCPGRGLLGIAGQIAPQDGTTLLGKLARKSTIDPDEAVLNELLDLRVAERARWFAGRHENPLIAGQMAMACAKQERPGCFCRRLPPACERATRSAREEEDRSDIGGADHHGKHGLANQLPVFNSAIGGAVSLRYSATNLSTWIEIARPALLQLDTGRLDHRGPAVDFLAHVFGCLVDRAAKSDGGKLLELFL